MKKIIDRLTCWLGFHDYQLVKRYFTGKYNHARREIYKCIICGKKS